MEVNIKPQPKKKASQERLEKALEAIGSITESLEYHAWAPCKTYPKPIFAGGFSRDMRLGLDFDDIDIYVPDGFICQRFLKDFEDVTLLTPVKTSEEIKKENEAKQEKYDELVEKSNDWDEEAYKALCEIELGSGATRYNPSEGGLKLVWSFKYQGFNFNLMLMERISDEPTQVLFEKQVMNSFNCCLARTYLRLNGSQVFYPEFELAVETKRVYITRVNFSAKYINKMVKYFPDYQILLAEPVENLYGQEEKDLKGASKQEEPSAPIPPPVVF